MSWHGNCRNCADALVAPKKVEKEPRTSEKAHYVQQVPSPWKRLEPGSGGRVFFHTLVGEGGVASREVLV